jgi:hypothetical protein
MDYSSSHVVISDQYLVMLRQKALDKRVANKIREQKAKEKKKILRQVDHTRTPRKRASQKNVEKENRARFNNTWSAIVVRLW